MPYVYLFPFPPTSQFLTNVFFIPYLAVRAATEPPPPDNPTALPPTPPQSGPLPTWAPAFGATSLAVGLTSIVWALAARPEYGGLQDRLSYFLETFHSNRVSTNRAEVYPVLTNVRQDVAMGTSPKCSSTSVVTSVSAGSHPPGCTRSCTACQVPTRSSWGQWSVSR